MKHLYPAVLATFAAALSATAAPRLVVTTPSLAPESQIDLVLDLPAVETAGLGKITANTWLEIQPPLPGKLRWKAQNIAEFLPEQVPAIGATYTFSIPKNLKYLDQTPIPAGKFATVESEKFRILNASEQDRWTEDYSPATSQWMVVFNDDVDPASAAGFISFASKSGQRVAAKLERASVAKAGYYARNYQPWSQRIKGATDQTATAESLVPNILLAVPLSPLPVGEGWQLSILKGLPNATTSTRMLEDASYAIGKVEPFQVTGIRDTVEADEPRRIEISFSQPLPVPLPENFLRDNIDISPRPENLEATADRRTLSLTGDFNQTNTYQLTVKQPLLSRTGLPLIAPVSKKVEFKFLEPSVVLPSHDQAQLAEGSRTYRIQTVNIGTLHVRVKRLAGIDLIRAYQGYRNYTGVGPDGTGLSPTAPLPYSLVGGETVYEKDFDLQTPVDHSKEVVLNWNEILPQELRNAALFLDVTGTPHPATGADGHRNAQSIVQLTDIGLAWKITEKDALVYAFSCLSGKPLPGVALSLFGEDARTLASATTDASGLASFSRLKDLRHLQAKLGGDSYLTAFDGSLSTVGLWHFPIRYSWNKAPDSHRSAFLFSDRSLYRPGETVRVKGIVRSQRGNLIEPAPGGKARMQVVDPTENVISSTDLTISETGSFDFTTTLPKSTTGSYVFRLEYPDELAKAEETEEWQEQEAIQAYASFSLNVRVEEFRRNAFEVKQNIPTPEIAAVRIATDLSASYYQGQPVAAAKVKHFTRIAAENLYPERFRDFYFGDHRTDDWHYWYHYFGYRWDDEAESAVSSQSEGEVQLSADGRSTLAIDIPQSEFPTAREVTVSSEVTDANNQTLTAVSTTTVHPASLYVGVSRADRIVRVGETLPLKLVAIDPDGNPFPSDVKLTATLTRDVNSATKTRNKNGESATTNAVQEETLSTREITIPAGSSAGMGQDFSFTPTANGQHFLTLRGTDANGHPFATVTSYYVYGTQQYPWLYEDGLRVKLVAEKKSYRPGETARVLVLSPIEGTALVTIEREKVLRSFQVQLKADNPVIDIPLHADDAPNAYVSVLIVKGAGESAREHKEPQLRLGYCELIVENQQDLLQVSLSPQAKPSTANEPVSYRPGDAVTVGGTVMLADGKPAAGAEVTLYAEDEGTLAVMGYETPRPMDYFYKPRNLGVETGISFESFISEDPEMQDFSNKGFFIGGGGDLSKLAELYRKNFDPCATWAPSLKCDASGKFSHTFNVPDTLTRYRLIAIAHHEAARFGTAESAITVKKDLMLEPKAPRFANQTDRFRPQVLVQNASHYTGTWEISLGTGTGPRTPNMVLQGPDKQTVTLAPGASTTVVFDAIAQSTGEAVLSWKATPVSLISGSLTPELSHQLSDAVETRFPIHYPVPLFRQAKFVKVETAKKKDLLATLDPALLAGDGELTVEFSRSPLLEAAGSIDYLLHYPYGCVEQTTSSLIPWLAVENLKPYVPAFAKLSEAKVTSAIQTGADRLLSMQLPDGSFSYWPGSTQRVDWATSYAGLGLLMAANAGANVPEGSIDLLKKSLIESLRGAADVKSSYELEIQARTLFVLSLAEAPQPAYQNVLKDRMGMLTQNARAFLAMAIALSGDEDDAGNKAAAKAVLLSKTPFKGQNDDWMVWHADQAYTLLAWMAIDPESTEATTALDRLIRDRNPYGHWNTTWCNGWSLLGLSEYAKQQDPSTESTLIVESANGTETLVLNEENPTATRTFTTGADLKLALTANSSACARVQLASKPAITPLLPVAKNGLSIDRIHERVKSDGSTEILTEPAVGDLIKVTLRVTLPKDNNRYLVIEDPLPAAFETVNADFKSQSAANGPATSGNDWQVSHSELRDDRAVFFLDEVWRKGTYNLTYLARCTMAGQTTAPPAKVESMYDPDQVALSASRIFISK